MRITKGGKTQNMDANALKERFNPEGSLLRRQQERMTEMLLVFDDICRRNNISYWLCSGTLLGCIRHGGYIPWDDDLDVEVMRDDYERLMRILPQELPEKYKLQNHNTDPGYFFCFAKLRDTHSLLEETNRYDRVFKYRGIFIDIFPYEHIAPPLHWLSCRTFGRVYKAMNNPKLTDEQAMKRVNRIYNINHRAIFPLLRLLSKLWPSKMLRYSPGIPYPNATYHNEIFPLKRAKFEGYDMPIPHDTDSYLKRKFGDYMQLPNLDNIHPHSDHLEIYD